MTNMPKWTAIALIGFGLLAFGFKVRSGARKDLQRMNRMPVAVAAIRGGTQDTGVAPGSNVAADYANVLRDDVSLARKNVDKMKAASAAHFGEAADAENHE